MDGVLRLGENRFGSQEVQITSVQILDPHGQPTTRVNTGEGLALEVRYTAGVASASLIFAVSISREDGLVLVDTSTMGDGVVLPPSAEGPGQVTLYVDRLDLVGGSYFVDVGVYTHDWAYAYDFHWHVYPLVVEEGGRTGQKGILQAPHRWEVDPRPLATQSSDGRRRAFR
jgi:lipopolysaccharide transport system ATP-binding protein